MKKFSLILIILVTTGFIFQGCKKDFGEVGDWPSKTEAIKGIWKATQLVQVDSVAFKDGKDLYQMDMSDAYNATDFTIEIKGDGTFNISGAAHNFAKLSSGTWSFDDPAFPSKLQLTNGTVSDHFAIVAPPKVGFDTFTISYIRYSSGKAIIGYEYHLKKQ
jgi:hypothetical protein